MCIYISPTSGIQSQILLVLRCSVNGESGAPCLLLRGGHSSGVQWLDLSRELFSPPILCTITYFHILPV